jgi:hypothetical protein
MEDTMKILGMLKMNEQVGEPPAALFDAMDATVKEIEATTRNLDTNGLLPTADAATRITVTDGKVTVLDGPFTESRELVGGYAFFEVDTFAEGVEAARKIVQVHVDHWPTWEGEIEVRQVMG